MNVMSTWTIAKRLAVGLGVCVSVIVGLGAFAVSRLNNADELASHIALDSLPGVTQFGQIRANILEMTGLMMEHMASEDPARLDALEARIKTLTEANGALIAEYQKTITSEEDQRLFGVFKTAREAGVEGRNAVLAFSRTHDSKASFAKFEQDYRPIADAIITSANAVAEFNAREGSKSGAAITASMSSSIVWVAFGSLMAVLAAVVCAWVIVRGTNRVLGASVTSLSNGAAQVVTAAGQVAASAQTLSQGATEQASSLEETSASMEEMASMARRNSENAREASGLMAQVDTRVGESNQRLQDMVVSMQAIQESSNQVAKIIKTIDEIAFQTNILALNAAVEAARAGEAGMGFAVVADEVRNLAQRSAQAAKDTATLIEASIASSTEGNHKVNEVAASISAITESVSRVKHLVDEVRSASGEQTQGIEQVAHAVAQMEKVTQSLAATAEESAAASEELNAQAETSLAVVAEIGQLIGQSTSMSVREPGTVASAVTPMPVHQTRTRVLAMTPRGAKPAKPATASSPGKTAEDLLPLEDTGTYAKF